VQVVATRRRCYIYNVPELTPQKRFTPTPGGTLTPAVIAALRDEVAQFESGQIVTPIPRVLGQFSLLPHEQTLLTRPMGFPYNAIHYQEGTAKALEWKHAGCSAELGTLLTDLLLAFRLAVEGQIKHVGSQPISNLAVRAGDYRSGSREDAQWHPDGERGILRLVASFGSAPPTEFAHGPIRRADFPSPAKLGRRLFEWDDKRWKARQYGIAALTLFVSDYYVHRAGNGSGTRAFYSASVHGLLGW